MALEGVAQRTPMRDQVRGGDSYRFGNPEHGSQQCRKLVAGENED